MLPKIIRIMLTVWALLTVGTAIAGYGAVIATGGQASLLTYLYNAGLIYGGIGIAWAGIVYGVQADG